MRYAVKTLPTGGASTEGTVIPPVLGTVDLWDGTWAAAPHYGNTSGYLANYGASASMPTIQTAVSTVTLGDPAPRITLKGSGWMVNQNFTAAAEYSVLVIVHVRGGTADTIRVPGATLHLMDTGAQLRTGTTGDTPVPGATVTGRHAWAIIRRGGTWEVWHDGVLRLTKTDSASTSKALGLWPTGSTVDLDFYELRYAAKALTADQIKAATTDARAVYRI